MADVFISYKQDERAAIEQIATRLRALGLTVWFDASLSAGESFNDEIDREARAAKAVLVCWSPAARDSRWVKAEAMIGFEDDKLVACYVRGPDSFSPPTPFNTSHAEDLRAWLAAPTDMHAGWKSVLRRIGRLCGRGDIESWGALDAQAGATELREWIEAYGSSPLFLAVDAALQARQEQEAARARLEQEARERFAREDAERRMREEAERRALELERVRDEAEKRAAEEERERAAAAAKVIRDREDRTVLRVAAAMAMIIVVVIVLLRLNISGIDQVATQETGAPPATTSDEPSGTVGAARPQAPTRDSVVLQSTQSMPDWLLVARQRDCPADAPADEQCPLGEVHFNQRTITRSADGFAEIWVQASHGQPQLFEYESGNTRTTVRYQLERLRYRFNCGTQQFVVLERQIMGPDERVVARDEPLQLYRDTVGGSITSIVMPIACRGV